MMQHRSLLLRGNRFLGSALVDRNLISVETLDAANQKLLEVIQGGNLKQASILNILLFDLKRLAEEALINHLVDQHNLGLVDLTSMDIEKAVPDSVDVDLCWATWTIPFDKVDNLWFCATSYYLSTPIVQQWEKTLEGNVLWFVTSVASLSQAFDRLETARAKAAKDKAAAPPALKA